MRLSGTAGLVIEVADGREEVTRRHHSHQPGCKFSSRLLQFPAITFYMRRTGLIRKWLTLVKRKGLHDQSTTHNSLLYVLTYSIYTYIHINSRKGLINIDTPPTYTYSLSSCKPLRHPSPRKLEFTPGIWPSLASLQLHKALPILHPSLLFLSSSLSLFVIHTQSPILRLVAISVSVSHPSTIAPNPS